MNLRKVSALSGRAAAAGAAIVLATLLAAAAAVAQQSPPRGASPRPDDLGICERGAASRALDQEKIGACTRLIRSGRYLGSDLAILHAHRASGYEGTGQLALALSDFNAALKLQPDYAGALISRCTIHRKLNRLGLAGADCNRALALAPGMRNPGLISGLALCERAKVHEAGGRRSDAIADYRGALSSGRCPEATAALRRLGSS